VAVFGGIMSDCLSSLSAQQLFDLANKRQAEEEAERTLQVKQQIDALQAKRKQVDERYQQALAAIDYEILKLTSGTSLNTAAVRGRIRSIASLVIVVLADRGQATAAEIKQELESIGVKPKNLFQAIARLKGKGKVVSVARGVYALTRDSAD
jgi:hypothetical protein